MITLAPQLCVNAGQGWWVCLLSGNQWHDNWKLIECSDVEAFRVESVVKIVHADLTCSSVALCKACMGDVLTDLDWREMITPYTHIVKALVTSNPFISIKTTQIKWLHTEIKGLLNTTVWLQFIKCCSHGFHIMHNKSVPKFSIVVVVTIQVWNKFWCQSFIYKKTVLVDI